LAVNLLLVKEGCHYFDWWFDHWSLLLLSHLTYWVLLILVRPIHFPKTDDYFIYLRWPLNMLTVIC